MNPSSTNPDNSKGQGMGGETPPKAKAPSSLPSTYFHCDQATLILDEGALSSELSSPGNPSLDDLLQPVAEELTLYDMSLIWGESDKAMMSPIHPKVEEKEQFLQQQMNYPIGTRLLDAGLLSPSQVEVILRDQGSYQDYRFGEIVCLHAWMKPETIDFFLNIHQAQSEDFQVLPLGQRLKLAGLITDQEVAMALSLQRRLKVRMGHLLAAKGMVRQKTADFFAQL